MANILTVTGNPVMSDEGGLIIAAALVDAGLAWDTGVAPPRLRLYQNDPAIVPGMVLADFIECVWSGYVQSVLSGMISALNEDGVPMATHAQVLFTGANPLTIPGSATGWYLVDDAGTAVICAQRFTASFPIDQIGDAVQLTPRVYFPGRVEI